MIKLFLILQLILFSLHAHEETAQNEKTWEDLSPLANGYDWIQLTSGEWLKGELLAMYKEKVEFDSKELKLLSLDFEDIRQIKTYYMQTINVEDLAILKGRLFIYEDNVIFTMGEDQVDFNRSQIISIAHGGDYESDYWSGKVSVGLDISDGNTRKLDFNSKVTIKRRTPKVRAIFDYTGIVGYQSASSEEDVVLVSENHRANLDIDYFKTKYFFLRPLISEYYIDPFQNIEGRTTLGIGLGYTIFDTSKLEVDLSAGPVYKYTVFVSVLEGSDRKVGSPSFTFDINSEYEVSDTVDYKFEYSLSVLNKESGSLTHHMVNTFETEFINDFDIDIAFMWDYVKDPILREDGTKPVQNDVRLMLNIGYEF